MKKYKKATRLIEYQEELKTLTDSSEITEKLQKLYKLNKENPSRYNENLIKYIGHQDTILTAFEKLRKNEGASTKGTNPQDTVDNFSNYALATLQKEITTDTYQWGSIKRIEIPKPGKKKKRPLGLPNFKDKIVQECTRIVLECIYEPEFQELETNHGFRPTRSPHTAIESIRITSQGMTTAIEGDIKGAYDHVDHNILMDILKRRIKDHKTLNLIRKGLKAKIMTERKHITPLIGVPQGGIVSPLFFNIYMHEFDKFAVEYITDLLNEENKDPKRQAIKGAGRTYKRLEEHINRQKRKLADLLQYHKGPLSWEFILKAREYKKEIKRLQNQRLKTVAYPAHKKKLFFSYTRYADDWLILTNANQTIAEEIKKTLTEWLRVNLKLELDQEKTLISSIEQQPIAFLGFTIRKSPKQPKTVNTKEGKSFLRRTTSFLPIGIDHTRLKKRLKELRTINDKNKPIATPQYLSLPEHSIVEKFRQRITGLYSYYYPYITTKSELSEYHYYLNFSCKKTIARRKDISISQVLTRYGKNTRVEYETTTTNKIGHEVKHMKTEEFPSYTKITDWGNHLSAEKIKQDIIRSRTPKRTGPFERKISRENEIKLEDIWKHRAHLHDPLSYSKVSVNLRTGFKLLKGCAVCGISAEETQIDTHHIKKLNSVVKGFDLIMKAAKRKTIPLCKECHIKVHQGKYDGMRSSTIYDDLITKL